MARAACERPVGAGAKLRLAQVHDPGEEAGVAQPPDQLVLEDRGDLGGLAAVAIVLDGGVRHRKLVDRNHLVGRDGEAGRQGDEARILVLDVRCESAHRLDVVRGDLVGTEAPAEEDEGPDHGDES
jgi:hypothetical protein